MMPRTTRWTSAVRGLMKVSVSDRALATITDFSSGVRYRWCGCLPVGMRRVSVQSAGLMTLTLSLSELSTSSGMVGVGVWAGTAAAPRQVHRTVANKRKGKFTQRLSSDNRQAHRRAFINAPGARPAYIPYDEVMNFVELAGTGLEVQSIAGST